MEYCLKIGDLSIPYTVRDEKKTTHIRMTIDLNGLKIFKPPRTKMSEVERILKEKRDWIYKHYIQLQKMKTEERIRNWENNEKIFFKGMEYDISVLPYRKKTASIIFDGEKFEVFVNENTPTIERKVMIENALRKWYKKAASEDIARSLDCYCKIIGLDYCSFRIKEQKTRWGSCSIKKNLNFNWKLIMSPQWVMDYVVVHELCHLKYLNHSKQFWAMVGMYIPDYKLAKDWLKKNGTGLKL